METIMIVDDSDINRNFLKTIFEDKYRIIEAADGEEAIKLVESCGQDLSLILLDYVMPNKNGLDVMKYICEKGLRETLPVIIVTGDSDSDIALGVYEYGAADFVYKPLDPKIILRRSENIIELYKHRRDLENELDSRTSALMESKAKLKKINEYIVNALGSLVEFRSLESGLHIKRVSSYTEILLNHVQAEFPNYGLTKEMISLIAMSSALHDVGKIGIPDDILNKPAKLTPEEFEVMKSHSIIGCAILECFKMDFDEDDIDDLNFYRCCYEICRWHHEKADGKGYPDGLKGDEIPIWAHTVAVADCFDALTSKRVYKDKIELEKAHKMITDGECGKFSDDIMKCFVLAKDELFQAYSDIY